MAVIKLNFLVRLLSSVSHIGSTGGIDAEFHRTKFMIDEQDMLIPTITGNSIRGQLRDASALHMMRVVGLDALPLKQFYMLFSGGSLEKAGGAGISLENARRLRQLLPSVSVFGTAVGNHIMAGKWSSGIMLPHAQETASMLGISLDGLPSVYDLMQTEEYTRMDDAKDPRKEHLIEREAMQKSLMGLDAKRSADYVEEKTGAAQQMRYRVETMAAGALLSWRVVLNQVNDLEAQAWFAALSTWGEVPVLGGKSSVGHGFVEIESGNLHIHPDKTPNVPSYEAYETHLLQHASEIKALLYAL